MVSTITFWAQVLDTVAVVFGVEGDNVQTDGRVLLFEFGYVLCLNWEVDTTEIQSVLVLGVTTHFTWIVFGWIQTRQNGPEETSVIIVLNVDNRLLLDDARWCRDVRQPGHGAVLCDDEAEVGHGVHYKVAASGVKIVNGKIQLVQQLVEVIVVTTGDMMWVTGKMSCYVLSSSFRLSRHGGVDTGKDSDRSKTRDSR